MRSPKTTLTAASLAAIALLTAAPAAHADTTPTTVAEAVVADAPQPDAVAATPLEEATTETAVATAPTKGDAPRASSETCKNLSTNFGSSEDSFTQEKIDLCERAVAGEATHPERVLTLLRDLLKSISEIPGLITSTIESSSQNSPA